MIVPGACFMPRASGDPYLGSVVLAMHFDNDFVDGTGRHTFSTMVGTPSFSTGMFAEGGLFTSACINTAVSSDFVFSTDPFTFEFFVKFNDLTSTRYFMGTSSVNAWFWAYHSTDQLIIYQYGAQNICGTVVTGQWYHVAIVGEGGTTGTKKIYLDGVQAVSNANQSAQTGTTSLEIGAAKTASGGATASVVLDDIRITKGIARYTANFSPPTAPFPNS